MIVNNARTLPTRLALSTVPTSAPFMSVILKATFILESSRARARLSPNQLPILESDIPLDPGNQHGLVLFESDRVPFKPRTDIVLVGDACSPHGRSTRSLDVEIRVGAKSKVLRVFGERRWSYCSLQSQPMQVGPAEFTRMPLTYDRAFGGIDQHAGVGGLSPRSLPWYAKNPHGRGYIAARTVKSIHGLPLPNIEDPGFPIQSWHTCPPPAGCAFFPRNNEARLRYAGTYDAKWKTERAPEPPLDFSFDFYNGAHPDLQTSSYLTGNEVVQLKHVDPETPLLTLWLPCWLPRLRARRRDAVSSAEVPVLSDAPFQLDTIVFIPGQRCFFLVWRAKIPLQSLAAAADIVAAYIDYDLANPAAV
jgi:hypothetical protein